MLLGAEQWQLQQPGTTLPRARQSMGGGGGKRSPVLVPGQRLNPATA